MIHIANAYMFNFSFFPHNSTPISSLFSTDHYHMKNIKRETTKEK